MMFSVESRAAHLADMFKPCSVMLFSGTEVELPCPGALGLFLQKMDACGKLREMAIEDHFADHFEAVALGLRNRCFAFNRRATSFAIAMRRDPNTVMLDGKREFFDATFYRKIVESGLALVATVRQLTF